MRRPRTLIAVVALSASLSIAAAMATGASAQTSSELTVEISPSSVTGAVGDRFEIDVTITNTGASSTSPLAAHIDVTDPRSESSVDPEDWTATLTLPVSALEPGARAVVQWNIQPIAPGEFLLYAVALEADRPDDPAVAVSNAVPVSVAERRSLNPRGVLPVVIVLPLLLGSAILVRRRQLRKSDGPRPTDTTH